MDTFLHIFFIISGFLIGTYGTLVGVGGGFLLIPLLLILYPNAPSETITSISLSVIFFNSLSGTISYWRMKRINFKVGILFALSSIPGSIAGALTTSFITRRIFEIIFGLFLMVSAIFLSFKRFKNNSKSEEIVTSSKIKKGAILSFIIGYLSAMLGVAGGIIHVPVLVYLLNFPVHIATATSHFILFVITLFGALTHVIKGSLHNSWLKVITLTIGVIPGAGVGAYLSSKIREIWIIRALTIAIFILGLRLVFLSLH